MAHHQLDELDEKILKLIIGNARMPFLEVARECNVSGAAIHQRIQKLTNLGVIKGSEFIVDNTKVGYETCAYMGLYLKSPGQFPSVTEALKEIPEVVECHCPVNLIHLNVCIINEKGDGELRVCSADILPSPDFEKRIGYTSDPTLWDSLISNYNSLHPDEPLIRWV